MSDFRKPVRARIMWDFVVFWTLALPLCVLTLGYVAWRLAEPVAAAANYVHGLALANGHALRALFIVTRALWG